MAFEPVRLSLNHLLTVAPVGCKKQCLRSHSSVGGIDALDADSTSVWYAVKDLFGSAKVSMVKESR